MCLMLGQDLTKKLKEYEPIIGEIYDIKFVDELTYNFAKESW